MWITGTASGLKDLLEQVKDHADDAGWTVNSYTTGGAAPNTDVLYLEAPGYGVGFEGYVQIRTYEDAPNNHFCLELRGATGFDGSVSWDNQPGRSPLTVFQRVWDATMTYWLAISDRRLYLVAKCSNTYHAMYAGFFNPFANPIEYPYPMYIAADAATVGPFGNTDWDVRAPAFPGRNGAFMRSPDGLWRPVCVFNDSANFDYQTYAAATYTVWPYGTGVASFDSPEGNSQRFMFPPLARVQTLPGVADTLFMQNCYLMSMEGEGGVAGSLEGLYWVPGNTLSAEQQLTVDGETYRTFIGISRSIESPSQFYAVKEV